MDNITLIIIAAAVAGFFLLLIVGAVSWFLLRGRGNNDQAASEIEESPQKELKPVPSSKASPVALDNGTEKISGTGSPQKVAPAPPPANRPPAVPIADIEVPEETDEKIKILIVDDNVGTRENVGRLLYFEQDMEVIGQAINGRQGIEMAADLKPHIVLMDINMPDMDGITATEKMSMETPYSQVIIMSVQAERDYMKRAMAAGARDFQPKPFTADELIGCIRRVYKIGIPVYRQIEAIERAGPQAANPQPQAAARDEQQGGVVIVVYSAKGGIGTSSIAVNLAAALQQIEGEVALIDTDLQFGDVSVHLNTQPTRTMIDAIHNGTLDAELIPELMLAHNSGLKLLLGPSQPELAESVAPPMLPQMINEIKKTFKFVIVDAEKQLNDKSLNVLACADHILMIAAPELPAIKNAKSFLDLAPQIEIDPQRVEIVLNRANTPGGIPASKIEKALKVSHLYSIPLDPRMGKATNRGVTVVQQDSGAPAAKALMALAHALHRKVMGQLEAMQEAV